MPAARNKNDMRLQFSAARSAAVNFKSISLKINFLSFAYAFLIDIFFKNSYNSINVKTFTVCEDIRLDKFISRQMPSLPYFAFNKLLRRKDVKVNGKRTGENIFLKAGDTVAVYADEDNEKRARNIEIIFGDENVLIADKKDGITSEELFESLKESYKELYFVHRLDRNTSGLIIFAKNANAYNELLNAFKKKTVEKLYKARVYGQMPQKSELLTAYIFTDKKKALSLISDVKLKNYTEIKTRYSVESYDFKTNTSVITVKLITGKTHQIRAHLAHTGHFVIGDGKYGSNEINKSFKLSSQQLTAHSLKFNFNEKSPLYYLNGKEFKSKYNIGEL